MLDFYEETTAFNMNQSLMKWRAKFNFKENFLLITDNASHFSNNLLKMLREGMKFRQKFSIANAPFTNGNVETANTLILTHMKQLCSEYRMPEEQWPLLVPLVEYIINNKKMKRRRNYTPNQLFLGVDAEVGIPLERRYEIDELMIVDKAGKKYSPMNVDHLDSIVDGISDAISKKVDKVYDYNEMLRNVENARRNKNRYVFQFQLGDWVMYSRKNTPKSGTKLHFTWIGPYQIV